MGSRSLVDFEIFRNPRSHASILYRAMNGIYCRSKVILRWIDRWVGNNSGLHSIRSPSFQPPLFSPLLPSPPSLPSFPPLLPTSNIIFPTVLRNIVNIKIASHAGRVVSTSVTHLSKHLPVRHPEITVVEKVRAWNLIDVEKIPHRAGSYHSIPHIILFSHLNIAVTVRWPVQVGSSLHVFNRLCFQ